jgi:energy-coupling factor transport system ATP-binding protein
MAIATVQRLTFSYPGAPRPALQEVSFTLEPGEVVLVLGSSGSGKSTLLRALAGLVPHFHGGRFSGSVEVAGRDTRACRPAELAGTVATVFQDPEDQVVMAVVRNEVSFGLENVGVAPPEIGPRVVGALRTVGAAHLAERRITELSAGELQRVCVAASLALDPELLLLDEPTSQLDPGTADDLLELVAGRGCAVVLSEQRPSRPLELADRVLFLEGSRLLLDAARKDALAWLGKHRPEFLPREPVQGDATASGEILCALDSVSFAYGDRSAVLERSLELRRGEIVALTGPNGSGKTTLAKLVAGLLEPQAGSVRRDGRAAYLSQDPGRYLACGRALDEVALGVGGNQGRARAALASVGLAGLEDRHPRDLSSGERERLALAAVLVLDPDVLVLDEPTRGVDPGRKDDLAALLRREALDRATLVVTHDLVFAAEVADRVVSLAAEPEVAFA